MSQRAAVEVPDPDMEYSFLFEDLPDAPQATICSLANTPRCPSYVLLAAVSKCWSETALQHLAATGASVSLSLACTGSSSTEDNKRGTERLVRLSAWLRKYGHTLHSLDLESSALLQPSEFVPGRGQGVPGILEALAAAGTRSAGLRLQQLPAIGCATPASIASALSGCPGVRQLQLDYTYSANAMELPGYTQGKLPGALQQLTQLTFLRLNLGELQRPPAAGAAHPYQKVTVDHPVHSLPSSLEVLDLAVSSTCSVALDLSWASLQHMVALRQLILPRGLRFSRSSDGHQLSPLTSVTYLDYEGSVHYNRDPLLRAHPNIVELWGGVVEDIDQLAVLNTLTALKSLGCMPDGSAECAAILAELTQLTSLALWMGFADAEWVVTPDGYGHAVGLMTGLRSLAIEPEMLELADATALTALTRLELSMAREEGDQYTPERLQQMLQRVAPAHGQLREVQVVGLDASQHGLYRAAVTLVFAATCGRPLWCMCCPSRLRQV